MTVQPHPAPTVRPAIVTLLAIYVIAVSGIALYWGTLRYPLVFDDEQIQEAFLRFHGTLPFKFDLRFVSYASFGWTHTAFGLHMFWFRLGNALAHVAAAIMLYLFLVRLFEVTIRDSRPAAPRGYSDPRWFAFGGAMLFLMHPVSVYGVAYLVQRPIVMATFFGLLFLRLFLEALVRRSQFFYLLSASAFFLALFSKEHAIALPAVALALALLIRGPSFRLLREIALPFALFASIAAVAVLRALDFIGAQYEPFVQTMLPELRNERHELDSGLAIGLSMMTQGLLFFRYLLTWIIPWTGWMSVDIRPAFPLELASWPHLAGFAAWIAYGAGAGWLLLQGGRKGLAGFGLLFPWLLALTEMAAIRIQEPFALYRSYLWMSGLPAVLPALFARVPPGWTIAALALACVALIAPAKDRLDTFATPAALWDDAIRKNPAEGAPLLDRAYYNRALAYLEEGRRLEALQDFDRAIELKAKEAEAYVGRAALLKRVGRRDDPAGIFGRGAKLDAHFAQALEFRCGVRFRESRIDEALADCTRAAALVPDKSSVLSNLGVVFAAKRETEKAEANFRRALELDPENGEAHNNYGVLLVAQARRDEARHHLEQACKLAIGDSCATLAGLRHRSGERRGGH